MIEILLNNEIGFEFPESKLTDVVREILLDHQVESGEVSLAVIDDSTMHELNRQHLDHDYPTDVLSFVLEQDGSYLEGEVIVSCDTATTIAPEYGWKATDELLLYFIHGCLHLVGYDDHSDVDRAAMRQQEAEYLKRANVALPAKHFDRVLRNGENSA